MWNHWHDWWSQSMIDRPMSCSCGCLVGSDQVIYPRSRDRGLSPHLYSVVPRVNAGELMSSQSSRLGSTGNYSSFKQKKHFDSYCCLYYFGKFNQPIFHSLSSFSYVAKSKWKVVVWGRLFIGLVPFLSPSNAQNPLHTFLCNLPLDGEAANLLRTYW